MTNQERSHIFRVYNRARALARRGELDGPRVNRALGLCLRNDERCETRYQTQLDPVYCSCPDFLYRQQARGGFCKHILALGFKVAS